MASITKLIPLVLLFLFLGVFAWIGYQMYLFSLQLADRGQKSMEKRNIAFNKDGGLKVGVKHVNHERESQAAQSALVNMWNLSSWPAYKSRLWNKEAQAGAAKANPAPPSPAASRSSSYTAAAKPSTSRHTSSASLKQTTSRP